jgi:hypothetical protein
MSSKIRLYFLYSFNCLSVRANVLRFLTIFEVYHRTEGTLHDSEIKITGHLDTSHNWAARKSIVLGKVNTDLTELIAAAKDKTICTSLAVFNPEKIFDFVAEPVDREWSKDKLASLQQFNLFDHSIGEGKF